MYLMSLNLENFKSDLLIAELFFNMWLKAQQGSLNIVFMCLLAFYPTTYNCHLVC